MAIFFVYFLNLYNAVSLLLSLTQGIFYLAEQQSLIALCSLIKNSWSTKKEEESVIIQNKL